MGLRMNYWLQQVIGDAFGSATLLWNGQILINDAHLYSGGKALPNPFRPWTDFLKHDIWLALLTQLIYI